MGAIATITAKGQITLPKELRDRFGLKPGDRVEFVEEDGRTWVRARNLRAADLMGILGPPPNGVRLTNEELDQAINDAAADAAAEDDARVMREWRDRNE
ncbi:AbrB family looped-hinge helix DNA binding protein [Mesorhizobium sp. J18]|uniref:AbrB/MazE/SpoVT family DNA-binding domain-containing protein n=1 Tax=Mesorhizobium sp. J18 TaxID=935263 RepID=UPI00119B2C92|nr:AbrB/MazE/SpoVT family DNA-binding domain-containing protein [Mesorhizobium sp. J18]TWG98024.1 AbrB family looped-hinge helix DNA binding protein [Mesorhizobium sp. J18]